MIASLDTALFAVRAYARKNTFGLGNKNDTKKTPTLRDLDYIEHLLGRHQTSQVIKASITHVKRSSLILKSSGANWPHLKQDQFLTFQIKT